MHEYSTKIIVVLLVIVSLLSASIAGVFLVMRGEERARRVVVEEGLQQALVQQRILQSTVEESVTTRRALEHDLVDIRRKALLLTQEVASLEQAHAQGTAQVDEYRERLAVIEAELNSERQVQEALRARLNETEIERVRLEEQLAAVTMTQRQYARPLAQGLQEDTLPHEVPLGTVVVDPRPSSGKLLTGRVLVVNREFAFVVVDVGASEEVEVGDLLGIYRHEQLLARAQVEEVHETVSVARLLPPFDEGELHQGYIVREL